MEYLNSLISLLYEGNFAHWNQMTKCSHCKCSDYFNLFCSFKFWHVKITRVLFEWSVKVLENYPACIHNLVIQPSEHNHNHKCTKQSAVHGMLVSQGTTVQSCECMIHVTPQSILPASSDAKNSGTWKSPATQTWSRLQTYMQVNGPWISNCSLTGMRYLLQKI